MNKIPLGSTVRCVITGVVGTATGQAEQINGNVRYDVQPKSEDGRSMPEAWAVDLQSLEVVDAGISERATAPRAHDFKAGQKVRDQITGHEGVITDICTYINGCVFANVVPRKTDKASLVEGAPAGSMIAIERLEVVGEGLTLPVAEKPTGGPSRRAARI